MYLLIQIYFLIFNTHSSLLQMTTLNSNPKNKIQFIGNFYTILFKVNKETLYNQLNANKKTKTHEFLLKIHKIVVGLLKNYHKNKNLIFKEFETPIQIMITKNEEMLEETFGQSIKWLFRKLENEIEILKGITHLYLLFIFKKKLLKDPIGVLFIEIADSIFDGSYIKISDFSSHKVTKSMFLSINIYTFENLESLSNEMIKKWSNKTKYYINIKIASIYINLYSIFFKEIIKIYKSPNKPVDFIFDFIEVISNFTKYLENYFREKFYIENFAMIKNFILNNEIYIYQDDLNELDYILFCFFTYMYRDSSEMITMSIKNAREYIGVLYFELYKSMGIDYEHKLGNIRIYRV